MVNRYTDNRLCAIFFKVDAHFVFILPLRMTSKNNFEAVSGVQRLVFVLRAKNECVR